MVRVDEGDMNELNGGSEMGDSREDDASLSLQLRWDSNPHLPCTQKATVDLRAYF